MKRQRVIPWAGGARWRVNEKNANEIGTENESDEFSLCIENENDDDDGVVVWCCSEWGWCTAVFQWGPIRGRWVIEPLHIPPTRRLPSLVQNLPTRRCLDARPGREVGPVDTPACDYFQHHHQVDHAKTQVTHCQHLLASGCQHLLASGCVTAEGATRGDGVPPLAALLVEHVSAVQLGGVCGVQLLHAYRTHIIGIVEEAGIEIVFGGHCGGVDSNHMSI